MRATGRPRKRNVRRLTLVGVVWTLLLLYGASMLVKVSAARPQRPPLPDLSAVRSSSRADPQLGYIVSLVAGRRAEVRCWSHRNWTRRVAEYARRWPQQVKLGPWAVYTSYTPVLTVHLSPEVCIELARLPELRVPVWHTRSPQAFAWAVQAIAHESVHVSGFLAEAAAECYGMQRVVAVASQLGRTRGEGRHLAELFWKRFYPWDRPLYRSAECRSGGALDLSPQTKAWP